MDRVDGCQLCGLTISHGWGYHRYEAPDTETIKGRMRFRRILSKLKRLRVEVYSVTSHLEES